MSAVPSDVYRSISLSVPTFGSEEINEAIESLRSGNVTMGEKCARFEQDFQNYMGVKHAIFVNSGSTANLLMMAALTNQTLGKLKTGDEVIVPSLTWSTTLWPVIQMGCIPVLVDCDIDTLCIDVDKIEDSITKNTRAIFVAHILGNGCDMDRIRDIAESYDLIVIEDACESLGTRYKNKPLGTIGEMGSFSFYFSHHITTIEGGMVVTNDSKTADLLRVLRAHGWTRHLKDKSIESQYPDIDPRFMFCNLGYSVRPTEIQGAFGIHQLRKLDAFNSNRIRNSLMMRSKLEKHPFKMTIPTKGVDHTWFAFPVIADKGLGEHLHKNNIDTRPIVAGNLARHPAMELYNHRTGDLSNADEVMKNGLYWGCHPYLTENHINYLDEVIGEYYA